MTDALLSEYPELPILVRGHGRIAIASSPFDNDSIDQTPRVWQRRFESTPDPGNYD
jgi:hypothetical protein